MNIPATTTRRSSRRSPAPRSPRVRRAARRPASATPRSGTSWPRGTPPAVAPCCAASAVWSRTSSRFAAGSSVAGLGEGDAHVPCIPGRSIRRVPRRIGASADDDLATLAGATTAPSPSRTWGSTSARRSTPARSGSSTRSSDDGAGLLLRAQRAVRLAARRARLRGRPPRRPRPRPGRGHPADGAHGPAGSRRGPSAARRRRLRWLPGAAHRPGRALEPGRAAARRRRRGARPGRPAGLPARAAGAVADRLRPHLPLDRHAPRLRLHPRPHLHAARARGRAHHPGRPPADPDRSPTAPAPRTTSPTARPSPPTGTCSASPSTGCRSPCTRRSPRDRTPRRRDGRARVLRRVHRDPGSGATRLRSRGRRRRRLRRRPRRSPPARCGCS